MFEVSSDTADIAFGANVDFDLTPGDYDSVSWNFGDGFVVNDIVSLSHTKVMSGIYIVTLSVYKNECSDESSKWIYVNNTTGIDENVTKVDFSVFPNPSKGDVSIVMNETGAGTVRLLDLNGRLIDEITINSDQFNYKLQNLKVGFT